MRREKKKKKKRNINNDLAVLPSHNTQPQEYGLKGRGTVMPWMYDTGNYYNQCKNIRLLSNEQWLSNTVVIISTHKVV